VLWSSGTANGVRVSTLANQGDGNLVIYASSDAVWASGTDGKGACTLAVQDDGNVVLYRVSDGAAVWATGTAR